MCAIPNRSRATWPAAATIWSSARKGLMLSCSTPVRCATWPNKRRSARWKRSRAARSITSTRSSASLAAWRKAGAPPSLMICPGSIWSSARKNFTKWAAMSMHFSSNAGKRPNRPALSTWPRSPGRKTPSATTCSRLGRFPLSSRSCRAATCTAPSASCRVRGARNGRGPSRRSSPKSSRSSGKA